LLVCCISFPHLLYIHCLDVVLFFFLLSHLVASMHSTTLPLASTVHYLCDTLPLCFLYSHLFTTTSLSHKQHSPTEPTVAPNFLQIQLFIQPTFIKFSVFFTAAYYIHYFSIHYLTFSLPTFILHLLTCCCHAYSIPSASAPSLNPKTPTCSTLTLSSSLTIICGTHLLPFSTTTSLATSQAH
jgi:hypothetical protein